MAATKNARDIFLDALDRAPADKAAYLDEACGGDAAMRQRVEALLRAHDDPVAFLSEVKPGSPLSPAAGERGKDEGLTVDSVPGPAATEDYGDPTARVGRRAGATQAAKRGQNGPYESAQRSQEMWLRIMPHAAC